MDAYDEQGGVCHPGPYDSACYNENLNNQINRTLARHYTVYATGDSLKHPGYMQEAHGDISSLQLYLRPGYQLARVAPIRRV